jgi:hypothetical protein
MDRHFLLNEENMDTHLQQRHKIGIVFDVNTWIFHI